MHRQETKNILLVDDHPIILDMLGAALINRFPGSSVSMHGTASATRKKLCGGLIPTLAVIDINLPDGDGIDLIKELHATYGIPVIAYSGSADRPTINACIKSGAIAFVPKAYDTEKLYQAIDAVISGGQYFPPSYLRNESPETCIVLSRRQQEVLDLVLLAHSNREIAASLSLAEGTVKNHVSDLLALFGTNSRNGLVLKARQLRIVQ